MPFSISNFDSSDSSKKFVLMNLGSTFFFLMLVSSFNYYIDPAGVFSKNLLEKEMASTLYRNNNIVVDRNYDERLFQLDRIDLIDNPPDRLIFGSSRILQVSDKNVGGKNLNLAVSGASLEDTIALTTYAIKKIKVSTIIIGVDPWIFNQNSDQFRWRSLVDEYNSGLIQLDANAKTVVSDENIFQSLTQLVSSAYTTESFRIFRLNNFSNKKIEISISESDEPLQNSDLIRKDGSRVYNTAFSSQNLAKINNEAKIWASYSLNDFKMSDSNQKSFEYLIKFLHKNFEVVLVLSPYQSNAFKIIQNEHPEVMKIEEKIKAFGTSLNIDVLGSYDNGRIGCADLDFYDGIHPNEKCMELILKDYINKKKPLKNE